MGNSFATYAYSFKISLENYGDFFMSESGTKPETYEDFRRCIQQPRLGYFQKKRQAQNVAVYWPGQSEQTRGRDDHFKEVVKFLQNI